MFLIKKINTGIDFFKWRYTGINLKEISQKLLFTSIKHYLHCNKFSVSILFSNNIKIINFNDIYRKKKIVTDIISFSFIKKSLLVADIIISYEEIVYGSSSQGKTIKNYIKHILIHGYLHSLGFSHNSKYQKKKMNLLENIILLR